MKALERYIKKNGKSEPFGKSKAKGSWKGPKGVKESGQYADKSGKKVVEDKKDYDETDPETSGIGAYESVRGYGKKKNKQRSYLD
jgi:hypothetical protein